MAIRNTRTSSYSRILPEACVGQVVFRTSPVHADGLGGLPAVLHSPLAHDAIRALDCDDVHIGNWNLYKCNGDGTASCAGGSTFERPILGGKDYTRTVAYRYLRQRCVRRHRTPRGALDVVEVVIHRQRDAVDDLHGDGPSHGCRRRRFARRVRVREEITSS